MASGIIYILINEAMPGYVKIGKTEGPLERRMRGLDTTGVPLPFECFYAAKVDDVDFVEKQLHQTFDFLRIRGNREFFKVDPANVAAALKLRAQEDMTPKSDVVEGPDDQRALDEARRVGGKYNMAMADIPVGTILEFVKAQSLTCTVSGKHDVEYEGQSMSLSKAALVAIQTLGYEWTSISGPEYWMYEGESLSHRRMRMETED